MHFIFDGYCLNQAKMISPVGAKNVSRITLHLLNNSTKSQC